MKMGNLQFGLIFLGSALFTFLYSIWTFPVVPGAQYGPEFFPCVITVLMGLCGAVLMVRGLRKRDWVLSFAAWRGGTRNIAAGAVMIGGIFLYIVVLDSLGFVLLAVLNSTILMVVLRNRILLSLIVSGAVTALAYFVFTRLLYVPLPDGPFRFL